MTQNYEIVRWIGINCFSKMKSKGGVIDLYWAFKEEAGKLWDGEFDEKLNWYTTEQMIIIYEHRDKNQQV